MDQTRLMATTKAAWRTNALFKAMSKDYLLREQFATDPVQILSDYVRNDTLTDVQADAANQLIFAVLSSPPMRRWMGGVARGGRGAAMSRHGFAVEFAKAAAASRDELVALALMRNASDGKGTFAARLDLLQWFVGVMSPGSVSSGTEMSPGGGTEMSPGHGTEMSPGATRSAELAAHYIRNIEQLANALLRMQSSGTEMSPGGGTDMSPGKGTEMSPGSLSLVERLASEARIVVGVVGQIARAASGTEMSPGGGTEMSPGRGTEMSPGAKSVASQLLAVVSGIEKISSMLLRQQSSGTEMSPGSGTEMSPGGGTEMSPGRMRLAESLVAEVRMASRLVGQLPRSAAGTEMSPGGGTEKSPGGTEMSPGAFSLGEQLSAGLVRAERLAEALLRANSNGTEMSPGGGTEMSPGHGTEMSPGAARAIEHLVAQLRVAARLSSQLARASGTEMSPGGGTEMSPGHGTEMSPGNASKFGQLLAVVHTAERLLSQVRQSQSGTEMSPGGGTEMSPGSGTEKSPGALSIAERLVAELRVASRMTEALMRQSSGTEMSPGGGTEMSPGGGTEMSPGAIGSTWGVQLPAHVMTVLDAVVLYAGGLRAKGALAVSGLESE